MSDKPVSSLAAALAAKAAEKKLDPNATPLQADEVTTLPVNLGEPDPAIVEASKLIKKTQAPKGSYIDLRLKWLILKDGSKVLPTDGYFVPANEDQAKMLAHFYAQGTGLVELVE